MGSNDLVLDIAILCSKSVQGSRVWSHGLSCVNCVESLCPAAGLVANGFFDAEESAWFQSGPVRSQGVAT